jgi:hypothetical protein
VEEIEVGSLVIFLEEFKGDTIPNVGLVMEIITFDELIGDLYGSEIIWYAVLFGDVDMVVSSEMIILLN